MQKKIIITGDGSPSLYINQLKETYHSKHGAITESDHVYIKEGFAHWVSLNKQKTPRIFEMGLGTGLIAYLSYVFALNHKVFCEYVSVEKYPLSIDEVQSLRMKDALPDPDHHHFFDQLHEVSWGQNLSKSDFLFKKLEQDFFSVTMDQSFATLLDITHIQRCGKRKPFRNVMTYSKTEVFGSVIAPRDPSEEAWKKLAFRLSGWRAHLVNEKC
jgi:hypothetical protein